MQLKNTRDQILGTQPIAVAVTLCGVIGIFASTTNATEHMTGANVLVPQSRIVNDDIAVAGSNVQVQSRVKGDVSAVGSNVLVSGPVKGDVLAAGLTVVANSPISDDLRAVGTTVSVLSPVGNNVMLAGGSVVVSPAAPIGQDADISGGSVQVQGPVGRNLLVNAGEAQIGSSIGGDVTVQAERLTLLPGAIVRGNLVVRSPNAPIISPAAKVLGKVDFQKSDARQGAANFGIGRALIGFLVGWMARFLWILVLGSTLLALTRPLIDGVVSTARYQFGTSIFVGFVTLVVVPVAVLLLLVTVLGIPLGLLLLAVHVVALLLSGVFAAHMLGEWVLERRHRSTGSPYKQLVWGALVLAFLMSLPLVGGLVQLATLLLGVGALVLERWSAHKKLSAPSVAPLTRSSDQPHPPGVLPA